jgi:hypothetical protein
LERCPHCERLTKPVESKGLRWVCGACKRPVVPTVDATRLDPETARLLREAASAATLRAAFRRLARPAAAITSLGALFVYLAVGNIEVAKPMLLGIEERERRDRPRCGAALSRGRDRRTRAARHH